MNKHLEYIGATLKYTRARVLRKPQILELGNDFVGVGKIESELADLIKTSTNTHGDIEALLRLMARRAADPQLQDSNRAPKVCCGF